MGALPGKGLMLFPPCSFAHVGMCWFKARRVPSCMRLALFLLLHHEVETPDTLTRTPAPCYLDPLAISIVKQTKFFRTYFTSDVLL